MTGTPVHASCPPILYALAVALPALAAAWLAGRARALRRDRDRVLRERNVIFGFIHDIAGVFADGDEGDLDPLLKRVLFYALRTARASAGAIYLFDETGRELRARALSGIFPPLHGGEDPGLERVLSKSQHVEQIVRAQPVLRGDGLIGSVADRGETLLIADAERDPRVPRYGVDFLHIRSLLLVPMRFQGSVLGVLAVVNRVDGSRFDESSVDLLSALADQASVTVHFAGLRETLLVKQRMDNDLLAARQIQRSLLPKELPRIEGVELAAFNDPAYEIGGDYYDVIRIDDRRLGIAIADVSGKGVGGALMMSVCRSELRAQAQRSTRPAEVLRLLNEVMSRDVTENRFVSLLYMVFDTATRELAIARAGHERPLVYSAQTGQFEFPDSPGIAIGIADTATFDHVLGEAVTVLKPGDVVVAYTDGITEAMNAQEEEWGLNRFLDAVRTAAAGGADQVLRNVSERLKRHVGTRAQYDDMTLLVLRVVR
jgi:sigma-B regulation protein RsbU (phosphoserine phosphatase)